jgi:hypothetical protein
MQYGKWPLRILGLAHVCGRELCFTSLVLGLLFKPQTWNFIAVYFFQFGFLQGFFFYLRSASKQVLAASPAIKPVWYVMPSASLSSSTPYGTYFSVLLAWDFAFLCTLIGRIFLMVSMWNYSTLPFHLLVQERVFTRRKEKSFFCPRHFNK